MIIGENVHGMEMQSMKIATSSCKFCKIVRENTTFVSDLHYFIQKST